MTCLAHFLPCMIRYGKRFSTGKDKFQRWNLCRIFITVNHTILWNWSLWFIPTWIHGTYGVELMTHKEWHIRSWIIDIYGVKTMTHRSLINGTYILSSQIHDTYIYMGGDSRHTTTLGWFWTNKYNLFKVLFMLAVLSIAGIVIITLHVRMYCWDACVPIVRMYCWDACKYVLLRCM